MEMELLQMVGTLGFPIALCIYLVVKVDKTIVENTKATQELTYYLKSGGDK